jgi:hypothetical protein
MGTGKELPPIGEGSQRGSKRERGRRTPLVGERQSTPLTRKREAKRSKRRR